jgi:hypothetical protein
MVVLLHLQQHYVSQSGASVLLPIDLVSNQSIQVFLPGQWAKLTGFFVQDMVLQGLPAMDNEFVTPPQQAVAKSSFVAT